MSTIVKILGFAGSGVVDDIQVLMTSGNFASDQSVSYMNMLDVPPPHSDNASRSKVAFADGTINIAGNIGFDVTDEFMAKLSTDAFLSRGYQFDIGINDGIDAYVLENCYYNSLSLTGSPGGLIGCSISAVSNQRWDTGTVLDDFIRDDVPLGYWYSGNVDVRDWTLNISQEVTPIFCNNDLLYPKYFRIGLWSINLEVVTYEQLREHDEVSISTKTFKITGNSIADGYSFNGQTDLGMYNHTFESGTVLGSGLSSAIDIITIT